jgi:hypothetical protein
MNGVYDSAKRSISFIDFALRLKKIVVRKATSGDFMMLPIGAMSNMENTND